MFFLKGTSFPALFSIIVWFACSMALIFTNRHIFIDLGFDFPITVTTWHLVIASFITRIRHAFTFRTDQITETNKILTWRRWATTVLPIGIFFSLSLGFANYSYLYLSVPFIQMLKSGTPIAILLVSWALRTEEPNWSTLLNILVICFGVGLASYGELYYNLTGFIYVILGITFESIRLVMIQKLLKGQGLAMDAMTALYYFAPVCAFFNFCAASVQELHKITPTHLQQVGVSIIVLNGAFSFGLNLASVTVVKQTSTLVLGLSGLIKDIVIVCTASLYFGTSMSSLQFFGYSVALLGLARYKLHKEESWSKFWGSFYDTKKAGFRGMLVIIVILLTVGLYELRPSTTITKQAYAPARLNATHNWEIQSNATTSRRDLMIDRLYAMGEVSWPRYLSSLDSGGLAPLTKEVQNWIYEWQHPPASECGKKKFVVSAGWVSGFGSMIHVTGVHLGMAIEMDRIMVFSDDTASKNYADSGCGTDKPYTSQECFFQPLSSCSYTDTIAKEVDKVVAVGTSFDKGRLHGAPTYWIERLKKEFAHVDLTDEFIKYWWRAQSSAYLMRLNAEASKKLIELRKDPLLHHTWIRASEKSVPVPYPLPPGTMNMHVRHGDKGGEMTLVPFTEYVTAGLKMIRLNPLSTQRRLFVSSEDPSVITDAIKLTKEPLDTVTAPAASWQVYTSDIPRINGSPFAQLMTYGKSRMTYFWLLQLMMNLECDMFVGTRGSNWNRLIDELRCVWVERCMSPYLEVGPDKDWVRYEW